MKVQSQGEGDSDPTNIDPTKMNMNMGGMSSEEMKETMENIFKRQKLENKFLKFSIYIIIINIQNHEN